MAITWGPTVNDRWRVGIEITQTASTDSTVTLNAEYFFWARYDISDSNNSFSASGSFGSTSGSRPVSTSTSGGTISLGSQSKTFNRAYGSASSVSQSISFSGLEAVGATLTAYASYSIPARAYSAPPAPTNLAATRSGTSASVSWTNNHSTAASSATYASSIRVSGYYQNADRSWVLIFTVDLANTATSYTRTGLNTTQAVMLGVFPLNSSGTGEAWTGWTYPVPAAPTSVVSTRLSDTQTRITWKNNAPALPDTTVILERSMNGGVWQVMETLSATTTTYTNATSAGNSYRYRVRTKYGDKYSSYAYSGTTYNTPLAPSWADVVRNSDAQYTISFKTNAPNRPGTYTLIERQANGGAWTQIASVSPTATSYIDRGTGANNYYRYRVRTVYGNAYSGYSTSGVYYNTPAKPSNVRAAKNADNSVTVSWNDNARTESGHTLQRSQDGGATWVTVTPSIAMNATSYTDTAAPGGSLMYRVEAHRHPLYSGWSAPSPSITTIAPPKAPTITDYPQATVSTEDGGFTIGWLHNPVDGSAQTAAEIAILPPGGSTETFVSIIGATSTYRVDTTTTGAYRISVRTKGAHADWSPWASHVYVTIAEPPTVIITEPPVDGEVIAAIPYTTSWTYDGAGYDPVSVDYHIQRQEDGGSWTTVYRDQTVAGNGSATLDAYTVIPRNGQTYRVHIWARAASGLTTMTDRVFTTDYVEPAQPVVTVEYDLDRLSASVSVEDGTPVDDEVMPVSYTVLRITDEDEVVLADHAMSGTTVTDPIPPLNVAYTYRIISHAASGAISEQDAEAYVNTPSTFAINYGAGMTEIQVLRWNVSYDTGGSKEQQHQAYEGRKFPVLYSGRRRNEKHSISATILSEEVLAWSALDDWGGVCVLRTNCGKRIPVSESHSIGRAYNNVPSISVKMERVDYELG